MISSYYPRVQLELASKIARGGDISFCVQVDRVRSKRQIMRQSYGYIKSCCGLLPQLYDFTTFDRIGAYRIIGIRSNIFTIEPGPLERTDVTRHGALCHDEIMEIGAENGLVIPPHELAYLIAQQQPIDQVPVDHPDESGQSFYSLRPMNNSIFRGNTDVWYKRFVRLSNVWDLKTNSYKVDRIVGSDEMDQIPSCSSLGNYRHRSIGDFFALFLAPQG